MDLQLPNQSSEELVKIFEILQKNYMIVGETTYIGSGSLTCIASLLFSILDLAVLLKNGQLKQRVAFTVYLYTCNVNSLIHSIHCIDEKRMESRLVIICTGSQHEKGG